MCKQFALIGWQIKHSASCFIHNQIFQHFKKNYSYHLIDIAPSNFNNCFNKLNIFNGINVTTPYKLKTFEKLKLNNSVAKKLQCVNTIKKLQNGKLKGYCTDHIGLLHTLNNFKQTYFKNILIIGFGGAGQMTAHCLKNNCFNLFIAIRNPRKIKNSHKTHLKTLSRAKIKFIKNDNLPCIHFDLVINATTCGNYNNKNSTPINLNHLKRFSNLFDLNYYPTITPLIKHAKKIKACAKNGVEMLVHQAIAAQVIWNNFQFSNEFTKLLTKKTIKFLNKI